jgi:F-type H+-transporting ATPase subunit b
VSGLSINIFWVIVAALNFILFLAAIWVVGFEKIATMLAARKARIEQGLADAEQARIAAAQKSAQDLRDADIAATREELSRLREKATADIAVERDRALAEIRAQVADLALLAAGKVVGESMTDARQRRLVDEFLAGSGPADGRRN